MEEVLRGQGLSDKEVDLTVADDDTVRQLNFRHRGLDEVTDVLAFSFSHSGHYEGEGEPPAPGNVQFPDGLGEKGWLGEVIVSFPQAARQAQEMERPLKQELAHLIVHGTLHLLGYDHLEPEEEATMRGLEGHVLARLFPKGRIQ
ncbi:MAG: rRNA maturation RNase YbeY [Chloroflexi bacterium]|nr:rRNA maturation RNase YbeY [Chloroflexota bacterium]